MKDDFESNLSDLKETSAERINKFGDDPENSNQLPMIEKEIRLLIGGVKSHLLEIGRLLVIGKKFKKHGEFQPWVEEFGFAYSTANNYMRLYLACVVHPEAVGNIPVSTMHEITSKKCPEELSEFLINNNEKLIKISKPEIKQLIKQFDKNEINIESPEIKALLKYDKDLNQVKDYKVKIKEKIKSIEKLDKYVDDFVKKFEWPTMDGSKETYLQQKKYDACETLIDDMIKKVKGLKPNYKIVKKINPQLKIESEPANE